MATTTYFDFTAAVRAINARTDSSGTPTADDLTAEEDRLSHEFVTPGWVGSADAFEPQPAASGLKVNIGSDGARTDYYVVPGAATGQGSYVARLAARKSITLDNADPVLGRKDEIYLVIEDNAYDANGRSVARFGYRTGTPAASPVAPGPDGGWNAYSLLATIDIPAGAPDISSATITDERPQSQLVVDAATLDGHPASFFSMTGHAHASDYAPLSHDGDTVGHPEATGSADGFMDSADKTELDGIEAGAEVNLTAGEILTGLKAVDGAGSGLDADLVDGVHASGLSTTGHSHGSTHFTEAESDAKIAARRNKPGAVFLKRTSAAGLHTNGLAQIVGTHEIQIEDWDARNPASTTAEIGADGAGLYWVTGQVQFGGESTAGYRELQLIEQDGGVIIAKTRMKAMPSGFSYVQVSALWHAVNAADEIQLWAFDNASSGLTHGLNTWFRVVALEL